jgi:hypothetical protein
MRIVSVVVVATIAALAGPAAASHVTVDMTACRQMDSLLTAMHAGAPRDSVQRALERILDTPSYRVMFKHYNRSWRPNHLPPAVFERMILSLGFPAAYTAGENSRADAMLARWRAAYADLPAYRRALGQLERAQLPSLVTQGVRYAQTWLPPGWTIPDFTLVVQPQGGSPAFAVDGAQGYDFFQIPRTAGGDIDVSALAGTIAHESNHLGMRDPKLGTVLTPSDSVALALVTMFVAEGVATEFISGPPAGRVPAIPGVPYHIFGPDLIAAWGARVEQEPEMMERLTDELDRAVNGTLSQEDQERDMREYWFEGAIGRAYVLGSEMFGAIELGLGRKAVFQAIQDPRQLLRLYNAAIDAKPELLKHCVRAPDRAVAHALAIGGPRRGAKP